MHKTFISYYHGDEDEVIEFVTWAHRQGALLPRIVHDAYSGTVVNSTDTEYVMGVIRRDILEDSTVTLVLLGSCTHSRRYVDWELKASLRQGDTYIPNGVLAVSLQSAPQSLYLPPRLRENCHAHGSGYAQWYGPPSTAAELADWVDDAYRARAARAHLIVNSADRMLYNAKCRVCGITH